MDPTLDPFSPQSPAQGIGNTPATTGNIAAQWSDALNDPTVRTSLLQFGLNLMQPPSWGDTAGSQIGRAIGSSGEALTRGREEDRRQQEIDSKTTLREAQAGAAEARAGAAGARAGAASERIGLERERLGLTRDRMTLTEQLKRQGLMLNARRNYDIYSKNYDSDILTQNKPPKMSFDEYIATVPELRTLNPRGMENDNALEQQARQAISRGANPEAVRQRYREKTGQEPNF